MSRRPQTPAGLCERCRFRRLVASARSVFVRCGKADGDPRFPKYPPLPVRVCEGFEEEGDPGNPTPPHSRDGDGVTRSG